MKKLLLLFCTVLLFSCEKQDLLETQSEPQQNISVENSTLPRLSEITFSKQQSEYKHQSIVETGIEVLEQQYNFHIDTAEVRKVKYRNYTSYTVAIRRPYETANFENLVIMMKNGEEDKRFYIVTYTPTVINIFDPHSSFSFLGERSIQQIFPGDSDSPQMMTTSSDCIGYWETWCSWGGTDHVAGPKCYEANDDRIFKKYVEDENCTETGGPTGGTGGGGSSSGDEPDPVFTSPTYPDGTSAAPAFLTQILSLTDQIQISWLENNVTDAEEILNFINQTGNTQPSRNFARTSIQVLMFGGQIDFRKITGLLSIQQDPEEFSLNNYPGQEEGMTFGWWNDQRYILSSGFFSLPVVVPNAPNELPNILEAALFGLFPAAAVAHVENSKTALDRAYQLTVENTLTGLEDGKADAFRHAFWNALGTAEFGKDVMKLFADAHEWNKSGLAVDMDLYNNNIGRNIGSNYGFSDSDEIIEYSVITALFNGNLKYILNGRLIYTNL